MEKKIGFHGALERQQRVVPKALQHSSAALLLYGHISDKASSVSPAAADGASV